MVDDRFNPRVQKIREVRGLLLDFLNSVYPGSLAEPDLLDVMLDLPSPVDGDYVLRDLEYMAQRGLLVSNLEPHPVRSLKTKRWKLSAKGVTFIERSKPWSEIEQL